MPSRYYAPEMEKIVFYIIDTEKFDKDQQTWLSNNLNKASEKTKIVLGHKPILTHEIEHGGENWIGRDDLKSIACKTYQAYISGHSHVLEDNGILDNCSLRQLVSGGGGANLRALVPNTQSIFGKSSFGFLEVVDTSVPTYTFYDASGQTLYSGQFTNVSS